MSGMLDVSAVLRMFVPWNSTARPPPSPKQAAGKKDVSSPPAVRWELFRFFNWLTSITFLVCVAHLASVQRRGVSVFVHSKLVVLVSLLCLVMIMSTHCSGYNSAAAPLTLSVTRLLHTRRRFALFSPCTTVVWRPTGVPVHVLRREPHLHRPA